MSINRGCKSHEIIHSIEITYQMLKLKYLRISRQMLPYFEFNSRRLVHGKQKVGKVNGYKKIRRSILQLMTMAATDKKTPQM